MKRKYIYILIALLLVLVASYLYVFQGHRDIQYEAVKKELSAKALQSTFDQTPEVGNTELLNATLKVTGTITQLDGLTVVLDNSAFFSLLKETTATVGETVAIKARCIGYDDLLGEVKLDQAQLLKN